MKILRSKTKALQGNTIVLAVIVTGLVGFVLAAYLSLVRSQHVSTMRSQSWNLAVAVIEAGVEDALAHLNAHGTTNLACDGWTLQGGQYVLERAVGDNFYVVGISNWVSSNSAPIILSRAYMSTPLLTASSSHALLATAGTGDGTPTVTYLVRGVKANTKADALFTKGLVAKGKIDLNGNNIKTDSFDSGDPLYSTNGQYDESKNKDNGDVATNSGLTNSVNVGNANIKGHVSTGPGGSVKIGSNGTVGSEAWVDGGNKGIQEGWVTDDMNVSFPDVAAPYNNGLPPSGGEVGGTSYHYVLSGGNWQINGDMSLNSQKKVLVTGNATLYVTGDVSLSGNAYFEIATNASLKLFVGGANASIGGNGVLNRTGQAINFIYYGLPSNTSLNLSGNGEFIGVIYAPNANFTLNGGGSEESDFIGASVTKTATLYGHYSFHYDENLARVGPFRSFIITTWDEMQPAELGQTLVTLPVGTTPFSQSSSSNN
jgi:hypothetical protein